MPLDVGAEENLPISQPHPKPLRDGWAFALLTQDWLIYIADQGLSQPSGYFQEITDL